jgi:hypothetical protein
MRQIDVAMRKIVAGRQITLDDVFEAPERWQAHLPSWPKVEGP